jgi:hypothetical protein
MSRKEWAIDDSRLKVAVSWSGTVKRCCVDLCLINPPIMVVITILIARLLLITRSIDTTL